MSRERVEQILIILGETPGLSYEDINKKLIERKNLNSNIKGKNSEVKEEEF